MRFRIFSTAAQQIAAHAVREHPHEACGLLMGHGDRVDQAVAARNVAADPARAFEIDPALLLRCHREARDGGPALLGWYHSHPNGRGTPSVADAARVVEWNRLWLIVAADRLHGYVTVPDGPVAGRFAAVDLIILPPGAPE